MLPLLVRRCEVKDAPRPSAASAADSVGPFLSWCLCIHPVSLPSEDQSNCQQRSSWRLHRRLMRCHVFTATGACGHHAVRKRIRGFTPSSS